MEYSRSFKHKRKINRKRIFRSFILVILLSLIGGGTFLAYSAKKAADSVFQEVDPSQIKNQAGAAEISKDPFNILLVGIEDQGGGERSDVLMLLTVDPESKQVYTVSIPRDTRTYIENAGYETKITESFSYGGIESTINTVNSLLDVPIDYYITTNFNGFEDIVNTLGGVEVNVPFTFKAQLTDNLRWKTYYEGDMKLNGNEALAYVRMRKSDPKGDMGRNERQQQVIKAIADKGTSFSSITKMNRILDDLGENIKTNIPPSQFTSFINLYAAIKDTKIKNLKLAGEDQYINNVYYYIPNEDSIMEVSKTLNSVLDPSTITYTSENELSSAN